MEMDTTTTQVDSSTQGTGVDSTEGVQTSVATETATPPSIDPNANVPGAVVTPQYTPNYKFKVGEEEKEFDEFLRGAVKDSEAEKKLRDLYTRAHGLEPLKTRLTGEVESWKTKASEYNQNYSKLTESLNSLSHHVNRGDFDSFFGALKIPEEAIYKWIQHKIAEQDMTPDQKASLTRQREDSQKLYMLERQNQELVSRQQEFQIQQNTSLLESSLQSQEVSSVAKAFDEKIGTPGAFKSEVLKRGVALYHIHGRDLSPQEVIQDLLSTMGKVFTPNQASAGVGATGQAKPPVIPNISGKSGSPVKTAPKTLKEIRERASTM